MTELMIRTIGDMTAFYADGYLIRETFSKPVVDEVHRRLHPPTGILPPVVSYLSPSRHFVILQRPPCIQNISFHAAKVNDISEVKEHRFALPMPWTLYGIELGQDLYPIAISVFALKHMIRDNRDGLYVLPLPNHYNSGALCMPPRDFTEQPNSVAEGINIAYRIAWMSGFNLDINYNIKMSIAYSAPKILFQDVPGKMTPIKLYKSWQQKSIIDIAETANWLNPIGYGTGPDAKNYSLRRYSDLLNILQGKDDTLTTDNCTANFMMMIKEIFATI